MSETTSTTSWYSIYRLVDNELIGTMQTDDALADLNTPEGCALIKGQFDGQTHYVKRKKAVPYTEQQASDKATRPVFKSGWDNKKMRWIDLRDEAAVRADKMAEIKAARNNALTSFEYAGNIYDSNPQALRDLFDNSSQPMFTSIHWRLKDNSWVELNAADAQGVWSAYLENQRLCFDTFRQLEAQVLSVKVNELVGINWPSQ